ncbi:MAG: hypothetical protein MJ188_03165 [Treponema sp.]|nr:hypothetical protein [Treponema sp.]
MKKTNTKAESEKKEIRVLVLKAILFFFSGMTLSIALLLSIQKGFPYISKTSLDYSEQVIQTQNAPSDSTIDIEVVKIESLGLNETVCKNNDIPISEFQQKIETIQNTEGIIIQYDNYLATESAIQKKAADFYQTTIVAEKSIIQDEENKLISKKAFKTPTVEPVLLHQDFSEIRINDYVKPTKKIDKLSIDFVFSPIIFPNYKSNIMGDFSNTGINITPGINFSWKTNILNKIDKKNQFFHNKYLTAAIKLSAFQLENHGVKSILFKDDSNYENRLSTETSPLSMNYDFSGYFFNSRFDVGLQQHFSIKDKQIVINLHNGIGLIGFPNTRYAINENTIGQESFTKKIKTPWSLSAGTGLSIYYYFSDYLYSGLFCDANLVLPSNNNLTFIQSGVVFGINI